VTQFESTNRRAASLLAEPVLVVKQKLKLVELRNEYGVFDPDGRQIGQIVKQIRLGKARFDLLDPGDAQLGEVRAENWRAKDFSVRDAAGQELARVTKRWAGLREVFTDADTYVVEGAPDRRRAPAQPGGRLLPGDRRGHEAEGLRLSSAGRREELQGDVVGVAEGERRAVVGVDDPAVRDPELLQPRLPRLQLGPVRDPERAGGQVGHGERDVADARERRHHARSFRTDLAAATMLRREASTSG
jgi:hypothetical protein